MAANRRAAGRLETEVLAVLWGADAPATPNDVHTVLQRDDPTIAYTTVLTTLSRLFDKGRVDRQRRGRTHAYRPTTDAARNAAENMRALLGDGPGRQVVLSHFVSGLSPEEEDLLRDVLARSSSPEEQS